MSSRLPKAGDTHGSFIEGKPKIAHLDHRALQKQRPEFRGKKQAKRTTPQLQEGNESEIVHTVQQEIAQASSLVSQWLAQMKQSDAKPEHVHQDEQTLKAVASEFEEYAQRPARLGLGAKFLTHKKATETMSPIQKKLERQIKSGQTPTKRENRPFGIHVEDEADSDQEDTRKDISKSSSSSVSSNNTTLINKVNPLASFLGKKRLPQKKSKKPRID